MESLIEIFSNYYNEISFVLFLLIVMIVVLVFDKKTYKEDEESDYKSFTIINDKKLSRNGMFSNCLVNNSDPTQDYYRFSFEGIEDVRLYLACIYDENNNKADVATTLQNYKGIIDFVDSTTSVIDKNKKVLSYDRYNFNFKESLKYIKEFTRELYETDLVLGLNNIIHAYSDDGYIDFYIIVGDEVFDNDFYDIIEKSIQKNFLDRRSKVMEEIMLEELECEEGKEEESGGDYSYENETSNSSEYVNEELLDELKETTGQVQDLITRVNEMTGSDISLNSLDSASGSIEVEEENIETCDLLRYITVTDDDGNEEDIQVKALPKKYPDWEERFSDELTSKEIDAVNELYAKWYAKKNKGKTITLPDGRTAKVNTSEEHSSGRGSGNGLVDAISSLSNSTGDSKTDALIGALSALAASGNMASSNQMPPEEPKGPEFDLNKLEETMSNNSK